MGALPPSWAPSRGSTAPRKKRWIPERPCGTDDRRRAATAPQDTTGKRRIERRRRGRRIVGNEILNDVAGAEGYFCPETVGIGTYRWSTRGNALIVRVVDDRDCPDRNRFWNGKFTR
jgi:hypothetical protein